MYDSGDMGGSFVTGVFIGILLCFLFTAIAFDLQYTSKNLVAHGCAQYNGTTGNIEWLDTLPAKGK